MEMQPRQNVVWRIRSPRNGTCAANLDVSIHVGYGRDSRFLRSHVCGGVAGTRTPVKFTTGASVTIGNVCIDKSGRMGRFYVFVVSDGVAYLTDSVGKCG